jgi:hypothetical protein
MVYAIPSMVLERKLVEIDHIRKGILRFTPRENSSRGQVSLVYDNM